MIFLALSLIGFYASTMARNVLQALAAAVRDAIRTNSVDSARVYLAGRGAASAALFYAIARVPDLWAAGIAIERKRQKTKPTIQTEIQ